MAAAAAPFVLTVLVSLVPAWPKPYSWQYLGTSLAVAIAGGTRPGLVALGVATLSVLWLGVPTPVHPGVEMFVAIDLCLLALLARWRRTQRQLSEHATRLAAIVESSDDAILSIDLDGTILTWNAGAQRLLGYTDTEIVGSSIARLLPPDRAQEEEEILRSLRAGRVEHLETVRLAKDGSRLDVSIGVALLKDAEGRVVGASRTIRDITDRKRAEEALRQSARELKDAQRVAKVCRWEWIVADNVLNGSEELLRTVRWDSALGAPSLDRVTEFCVSESLARLDAAVKRALETGQPFELEVEALFPDETATWGLVHGEAGRDEAGRVTRLWGTVQDITERKRAEAEREKLQAQLHQAQKMESIGRLAGGVAHDFNNMLGVIIGHTEMVLEQVPPGSPPRSDLEEIRRAAQRSADLTRQLLTFARKQAVAPQVLDLNAIVEGTLKMLRRLIGESVDLVWRPGPGPAPVKIDPSQLDQVLANLCLNARDALAGVGKITIETGRKAFDAGYCAGRPGYLPGDYQMLAVKDNGCGMDEAALEHLFEPFFTTKGVGKGTGLGLATVYGIVQQNDGFIKVDSQPGRGTTIAIYLPRHAEVARTRTELRAHGPNRGDETILLVEDEPSLLRLGKRLLESLGYSVLAANTPGDAVRVAGEHRGKIDLLLTDVVMPAMNGRDLAEQLHSLHPGLKRLFTSGYTADVIAHQGVLDEGVNFLAKPFSKEELAAKVREALDGES